MFSKPVKARLHNNVGRMLICMENWPPKPQLILVVWEWVNWNIFWGIITFIPDSLVLYIRGWDVPGVIGTCVLRLRSILTWFGLSLSEIHDVYVYDKFLRKAMILYIIFKSKILFCTYCYSKNFIRLYHVREIPEWNQAFPSKKTFASAKWWRREQLNMPLLLYEKEG